jgi:hypothetical protein
MAIIPINTDLTEELGVAGELGGDPLEGTGLVADIPDQPIAQPLRRIFATLKPAVLAEIDRDGSSINLLYKRFELWLVPHGVSIIRRSGTIEPVSVGIEVEYKNENRTCSVRSLIPAPRFVKHGHVHGSLAVSGEVDATDGSEAGSFLHKVLGLAFGLRGEAGLSVQFDATVVTPYLSAVGVNSSRCEWLFEKYQEALFGRDIQCWTILALPKRQTEINFNVRYSITARSFIISRRYASPWETRTCILDRG